MINTLRYANALKSAGIESAQAEAMAEALNTALTDHGASRGVAGKADVGEFRLGAKIRFGRIATARPRVSRKATGIMSADMDRINARSDAISAGFRKFELNMRIGVTLIGLELVVLGVLNYVG